MSSKVVVEQDISAKVIQVEKRGKEGSYKDKAVSYNGKTYTVGKDSKDKVKVGGTYHFSLTKSEYNDKLYYWANLVEKDGGSISGEDQVEIDEVTNSDKEFQVKIFSWLKSLPREKQILTIKYILDNLR